MAPVIKWVGGKQRMVKHILPAIPGREWDAYHEPFLGGGSVLEAILQTGRCTPGRVFASDINPVLVALHRALKEDAAGFSERVHELLKDQSEARFYDVRREFNARRDPERFVYINKCGFNGLYRENASGACNVPYGHGQRVFFTTDNCVALGDLYRQYDVQFLEQSWDESLEAVGPRDFVYLDPPFAKLDAATFTAYNKGGFHDTASLLERACALAAQGTRLMLSNHDVPEVTDALGEGWTLERFGLRRSVSCNASKRAAVEILARSY
jgi:DNA adenine methylase